MTRYMTKTEFKSRWESNETGGGITWNDIAECAKAWGLFYNPRIADMYKVRLAVLKAAKTNDWEEYNI